MADISGSGSASFQFTPIGVGVDWLETDGSAPSEVYGNSNGMPPVLQVTAYRTNDEQPYYVGKSGAVHVEDDSEEGLTIPLAATPGTALSPTREPATQQTFDPDTEALDSPGITGRSKAIRQQIDAPDLFDEMLAKTLESPHLHGRSKAIYVRKLDRTQDVPPPIPIQDLSFVTYTFDDYDRECGGPPMAYVAGDFFSDGAFGPTFEGIYAQSDGDRAFVSAFSDDGPPAWNLLINDDSMGTVSTYAHPSEDPHPVSAFPGTQQLTVWSAAADATGVYVHTDGDLIDTAPFEWFDVSFSWIGVHKYTSDGTPVWTTFLNRNWFSGDGRMVVADDGIYMFWGGVGTLLKMDPTDGSVVFFRELMTGPDSGLGHTETSYGFWPNTPPASPYNFTISGGYSIEADKETPWKYRGYNHNVWPDWFWDHDAHTVGVEEREFWPVGARLGQWGIRAKVDWGSSEVPGAPGSPSSTAPSIDLYEWGEGLPPKYTGPSTYAYQSACPIDDVEAYNVGNRLTGEWFDIDPPDGSIWVSPSGLTNQHSSTLDGRVAIDTTGTTDQHWKVTIEEFYHDRNFYGGCAKGVGETYYMVSRPIARSGVTVTGYYQVHRYSQTGGPQATANVSAYSTSTRDFRLVTHPDRSKFYLIRREVNTWYLDEWDGVNMTFIQNVRTITTAATQAISDGVGVDESTGNIVTYQGFSNPNYVYRGYDPDGTELWTVLLANTSVEYSGASMAAAGGSVYLSGTQPHGAPDFEDTPRLVVIDGASGATLVAARGWAADALWGAYPAAVAAFGGGGGACCGPLGATNVQTSENAEFAGGNCYVNIDGASYSLVGGLLVVNGGTTSAQGLDAEVETTPLLPFFIGDAWALTGRLRLSGPVGWDGQTGHQAVAKFLVGGNSVSFEWGNEDRTPCLAIEGDTFDSVSKSFVSDEWWYFRFQMTQTEGGPVISASAWPSGENEPLAWDLEVDAGTETNDFRMLVEMWHEDGAQQLQIDYLEIGHLQVAFEPRRSYIPAFKRQVNDPVSPISSSMCLLEAGAMALDYQTRGEVNVWGGDLIPYQDKTATEILVSGAEITDVWQAWDNWDQNLTLCIGQPWSKLLESLLAGHAVVAVGDVSGLPLAYQHGPDEPGHGLILLPIFSEESIYVGNPHYSDFELVPLADVQAYMEAFDPNLVWAITKAWLGSATGDYLWPVSGTVTQEYGCTGYYFNAPRGGCDHFHDGIDIAAPVGTPVYAPASGRVTLRGFVADGAFNVMIDHGGGVVSLLGHLTEEYDVTYVGARVARGEVVGHVGLTGHVTGSHLHWEITRDGNDFDPRSVTPGDP